MEKFDVAVIGSGPGGYTAAIAASQKGMKSVCIEKAKTFGGTCLNIGCIPSKALLESTAAYDFIKHHGFSMGIEQEGLKFNFDQMMKRKSGIVKIITDGVKSLFQKNKVHSILGEASLRGPHEIHVNGDVIQAEHIILAAGSLPVSLPFLPFDEKQILSSTGALSLDKPPKSLVIVGAGVIGVEIGSVYARLGTEVMFVEMLDTICLGLDAAIHTAFLQILKKQGLEFHLSASVKKGEVNKDKIILSVAQAKEDISLEAEKVLVSIGRKPNTMGLGLEDLAIEKTRRGHILVDEAFRTSIPSIYAIGDLIEGPMLAHRASEEGMCVAEIISGASQKVDYITIPSIIYTHPEVASVGLTEKEADEKGLAVFKGIYSLRGNGRARCMDDNEGIIKVIGEQGSGKLIGLHILSPHASELIGEGVIALKNRMTIKELAETCQGHPTLCEGIKEACLVSLGRPINV